MANLYAGVSPWQLNLAATDCAFGMRGYLGTAADSGAVLSTIPRFQVKTHIASSFKKK